MNTKDFRKGCLIRLKAHASLPCVHLGPIFDGKGSVTVWIFQRGIDGTFSADTIVSNESILLVFDWVETNGVLTELNLLHNGKIWHFTCGWNGEDQWDKYFDVVG